MAGNSGDVGRSVTSRWELVKMSVYGRHPFLVDLAGEPVGVAQFELVQRGPPALDDGALDEPGRGIALVRWFAAVLVPGPGSLVLDVTDGQPEQLDHRVVIREVPPILDDLAELVVQRLDRVRGVDHSAHRRRERQERDEPLPGPLPDRDRGRILAAQR